MAGSSDVTEWLSRINFAALVGSLAPDFNDAERADIAQDAHIKVWRRLRDGRISFEAEGALIKYVKSAVVSTVQDARRRRGVRKRHETEAESSYDPPRQDTLARVDLLDWWSRVMRPCIEALSEEQRRVLEGYYFRFASYDELGGQEQVSYDTLKTRLSRARQNLKACLERNNVTSYPGE
jgi:RNA polymerase sigma factor (sigma-70 family)